MTPQSATLDPAEIEKFSRVSARWWDESGPFAPLHRLNPVRLAYLRERIVAHYGLEADQLKALAGLTVLDAGCGGGLVCEPMARMGATVTGVDADAEAIAVARAHAKESGLLFTSPLGRGREAEGQAGEGINEIDQSPHPALSPGERGNRTGSVEYIEGTTDTLVEQGRTFDVVLALEIMEHVADVDAFLASLKGLLKPGGLLVLSTLNRTPKSFLSAIVGAEYVMRWLPRGTHDWRRFLKPSELARAVRKAGLAVGDVQGMGYDPLTGAFSLGRDVGVNYFMCAI
jgi:2-polyprenyl-6-hydroxyphenyl methylase/3-demethylubiquinone-9 3-methyltransferase